MVAAVACPQAIRIQLADDVHRSSSSIVHGESCSCTMATTASASAAASSAASAASYTPPAAQGRPASMCSSSSVNQAPTHTEPRTKRLDRAGLGPEHHCPVIEGQDPPVCADGRARSTTHAHVLVVNRPDYGESTARAHPLGRMCLGKGHSFAQAPRPYVQAGHCQDNLEGIRPSGQLA